MKREFGQFAVDVQLFEGEWFEFARFDYLEEAKGYAEQVLSRLKEGKVQIRDAGQGDKVVWLYHKPL